MDWAAALGTLSTSLTIVKQLRELDASMEAAESKARLVILMEQLSELRMRMIDAREESRALNAEVQNLKGFDGTKLADKIQLRGFYMDKFDDGSPRGTAYCPYCIETKAGLFRLHQLPKQGRPYQCPHCKTEYDHSVPNYLYEKPEK